jgi:hypothetical protein
MRNPRKSASLPCTFKKCDALLDGFPTHRLPTICLKLPSWQYFCDTAPIEWLLCTYKVFSAGSGEKLWVNCTFLTISFLRALSALLADHVTFFGHLGRVTQFFYIVLFSSFSLLPSAETATMATPPLSSSLVFLFLGRNRCQGCRGWAKVIRQQKSILPLQLALSKDDNWFVVLFSGSVVFICDNCFLSFCTLFIKKKTPQRKLSSFILTRTTSKLKGKCHEKA